MVKTSVDKVKESYVETKLFEMREISADKAYSARNTLQAISDVGAIPYIPFKKNARGLSKTCLIWRRMFNIFNLHQEEFKKHYHKRSNVETTFHMIKSKFSHKLNMKKPQSQINELLMKILCHNLCVLIQESHELGIEINFKKCVQTYSAQK